MVGSVLRSGPRGMAALAATVAPRGRAPPAICPMASPVSPPSFLPTRPPIPEVTPLASVVSAGATPPVAIAGMTVPPTLWPRYRAVCSVGLLLGGETGEAIGQIAGG